MARRVRSFLFLLLVSLVVLAAPALAARNLAHDVHPTKTIYLKRLTLIRSDPIQTSKNPIPYWIGYEAKSDVAILFYHRRPNPKPRYLSGTKRFGSEDDVGVRIRYLTSGWEALRDRPTLHLPLPLSLSSLGHRRAPVDVLFLLPSLVVPLGSDVTLLGASRVSQSSDSLSLFSDLRHLYADVAKNVRSILCGNLSDEAVPRQTHDAELGASARLAGAFLELVVIHPDGPSAGNEIAWLGFHRESIIGEVKIRRTQVSLWDASIELVAPGGGSEEVRLAMEGDMGPAWPSETSLKAVTLRPSLHLTPCQSQTWDEWLFHEDSAEPGSDSKDLNDRRASTSSAAAELELDAESEARKDWCVDAAMQAKRTSV
ncbi:hypothetical protein MUK42_30771 [Musa troglodytarum]|uniref:Uncharacterized protein n=1 Tax=Musa troglodytarum TaxID=320322 RepID=A0A9E7FN24_9LILI|nr:hypothetical protein MUK42_30771 [Musa troglodytarum]